MGFAGSHLVSWYCLKAIADLCVEHGDTLAAAFNVDREVGVQHSAFVEFDGLATAYGFPSHKVKNLSDPEALALLRALQLDVLFIIGWHRIVPQEVIDCAPLCLGMHSSLLPRNRGSAPVNWAIIRGERESGMTFFHLTTGVDSGDIIDQKQFPIMPRETCAHVYDKATIAAVEMLRRNWMDLSAGTLPRRPQDERLSTVNERRRPADGRIDWTQGVSCVDALIRAITRPYPGAFTIANGRKLLIWAARPAEERGAPGLVLSTGDSIRVGTGDASLDATVLQYDGDPECSAPVFSAIYRPRIGEHWS